MKTKNLASYEEKRTLNTKTGEVELKAHSKQFKAEAEPSYIKLYLNDIAYFHNLPKGMPDIIYKLLPLMNYEHQIIINSSIKRKIAKELNVSEGYINNSITKLTKSDIIIRVDKGVYELNSYLFGKGYWKDIIKHRKGLELHVFYKWKADGTAQRTLKTTSRNKQANNPLPQKVKKAN